MSFKNGPSDWKIKSSKNVYDNKDFSIYEDTIDLGGKEKIYIRGIRRDYVTIVPFVSDNEILMIKRYRHLTNSMQLEVLQGQIEQEGETPEHAASKMLQEKIGYAGQEIVSIGTYTLDYTMLEQKGHVFAAYGLRKVDRQRSTEDMERIDIVPLSIKDVRQYLLEGKISDASSTIALYRTLDYHKRRQL